MNDIFNLKKYYIKINDIVDGIFINSKGIGKPNIILISGYPDRGDSAWEPMIFDPISNFTKVIDYDRPGTIKIENDKIIESRSKPVKQPVSAKDQIKDIQKLVKSGKLETPFIMVAHSAGGLLTRLYAYKYPENVCGMILIDVTTETLLNTWTKEDITIFEYCREIGKQQLTAEYKDVELIDYYKSFEQITNYTHNKLKIDAIILSSSEVPNCPEMIDDGRWPSWVTQEMSEKYLKGVQNSHAQLANLFEPTAKHIIVPNCDHYIQKQQPQLIIDLIKQMVSSKIPKDVAEIIDITNNYF